MATAEAGMREKILETAKCLFIEHGYHGLAMREIAEVLGVTKPAIYYHFKDKEELFLAILNANLDQIEQGLDENKVKNRTCSGEVHDFIEMILKQPAADRAVIVLEIQEAKQISEEKKLAFYAAYEEKFISKIRSIFSRGIERGEFRPVDPSLATWTLLGILYPYLATDHGGSADVSEERIAMIFDLFINGVGTNPS